MKKLTIIALVISMLCMLTACGSSLKIDEDYAYIEITTSIGTAHVDNAFHGNNAEYEVQRQTYAVKYPVQINLADGETAQIHFHCAQCGYDEMLEEVVAPYARLFACECSGTLEEGNMKEYIAVIIGINADLDDVVTENEN